MLAVAWSLYNRRALISCVFHGLDLKFMLFPTSSYFIWYPASFLSAHLRFFQRRSQPILSGRTVTFNFCSFFCLKDFRSLYQCQNIIVIINASISEGHAFLSPLSYFMPFQVLLVLSCHTVSVNLKFPYESQLWTNCNCVPKTFSFFISSPRFLLFQPLFIQSIRYLPFIHRDVHHSQHKCICFIMLLMLNAAKQ